MTSKILKVWNEYTSRQNGKKAEDIFEHIQMINRQAKADYRRRS